MSRSRAMFRLESRSENISNTGKNTNKLVINPKGNKPETITMLSPNIDVHSTFSRT